MTSISSRTANADWHQIAVLCGDEALSAQRWSGWRNFALRELLCAGGPAGRVAPREFVEPVRFRANV